MHENELMEQCARRIIETIILSDIDRFVSEMSSQNITGELISLIDSNVIRAAVVRLVLCDSCSRIEMFFRLVEHFSASRDVRCLHFVDGVLGEMIKRCELNGNSREVFEHMYNLIVAEVRNDECLILVLSILITLTTGLGALYRVNVLTEMRFLPLIVNLVSPREVHEIQLHSLRIVNNVARGYEENLYALSETDILDRLQQLLASSRSPLIQTEVLELLSNISGNQSEIGSLIARGFVPVVLNVLRSGDFKLQRLAAYVLNNVTNRGSVSQIRQIIDFDLLNGICQALKIQDTGIVIVSFVRFTLNTIDCHLSLSDYVPPAHLPIASHISDTARNASEHPE